jgi:hypothetical protein
MSMNRDGDNAMAWIGACILGLLAGVAGIIAAWLIYL